jgi:hypothetical protein
MKGLKRCAVAGVLIMGMMSTAVYAADQRQFTDQDVIKILRADGYSSVELLEKGAIRIKVDGLTYVLFNREDGDLQAFFGRQSNQSQL